MLTRDAVGMLSQIVLQRLGLGRDRPKLETADVFRAIRDRLGEFVLGLFPKARQFRDAARGAGPGRSAQ